MRVRTLPPHSSLDGQTPDEVYSGPGLSGQGVPPALMTTRQAA